MRVPVNTIISEIMSNSTSAVLLFAPEGSNKTNFLTELSTRYEKTIWFNPLTDDVESPALCLAEKVFKDDDLMLRRIRQLAYLRSDYNNQIIIITSVLDYLSKIKSNILLCFERMECLPESFDLSIIERIIKHSPTNLKVVVSSDKFINFDYTKFEPQYPKLLDETVFLKRSDLDCQAYLNECTKADLEFLKFASTLNYIEANFASSIYAGGDKLLEYLSRKQDLISARDKAYYRINSVLKEYLASLDIVSDNRIYAESVYKIYGEYLISQKEYFRAFKIYKILNDVTYLDFCMQKMMSSKVDLIKLTNYIKFVDKRQADIFEGNYYYQIYLVMLDFYNSRLGRCYERIQRIIDAFPTDLEAYFFLTYFKVYILYKKGEFNLAFGVLKDVKDRHENRHLLLMEQLLSLYPLLNRELDMPIGIQQLEAIEKELTKENAQGEIWYINALQTVAEAYFDIGNYKKAMEKTAKIKELIPFYSIPHNLIHFYYYSGDIVLATEVANTSLTFALTQEITKDLSLVYSALASIDIYNGKISDAFRKYDDAVALDKENNYTKFFNISQRCIAYARYQDVNYAKEVAHIYLKYAENYTPQFTNMLECTLAYCYLKQKDYEKAYEYATRCVKNSKARSVYWLQGMAMATTHLLINGDLKDAKTLVKNIIKASYVYGMEMLLVDNIDIFEKLFNFALDNDIEIEYLDKIYKKISQRSSNKDQNTLVKVTMFGECIAKINGIDIQWKTKKAKELFFSYILSYKQGMDRTLIIDNLWKNYMYESAINNLKTTNNIIRKTLSSYNIGFELVYFNSRYSLKVNNLESDYIKFKELEASFSKEVNVSNQMVLMDSMLNLYQGDLALDVPYSNFMLERQKLKQNLIINMLKMIQNLAKKGYTLEVKNYIAQLSIVDKSNEYRSLRDIEDRYEN